ncbi:MAG: hypothetical protein KDK36_09455, partial [Leptospiraceae bacterium]|nr:hypothetical protein [Leptospiraceae bacterium]
MNDKEKNSKYNLKNSLGYLVSFLIFCICFFGIFFLNGRDTLIKPGKIEIQNKIDNVHSPIRRDNPSAAFS